MLMSVLSVKVQIPSDPSVFRTGHIICCGTWMAAGHTQVNAGTPCANAFATATAVSTVNVGIVVVVVVVGAGVVAGSATHVLLTLRCSPGRAESNRWTSEPHLTRRTVGARETSPSPSAGRRPRTECESAGSHLGRTEEKARVRRRRRSRQPSSYPTGTDGVGVRKLGAERSRP